MTKPYRYQRKGVRKITEFKGRALLADEMGLGKTLQALLYIQQNPDDRPIIVITLASLKWHWEREAAKHINMRAEILEGMKVPRHRRSRPPMLIINYDILGPWLDYLIDLDPQLIVIDECQAIKNRDTLRFKHVRALCKGVPKVLFLSGTPMLNRPAELWPTLSILRPKTYKSFVKFATRYCAPRRKPWGWEYKGATNLPELNRRLLGTCMIRRRKKDVLKDLPSKRRLLVPLELSDRKQYDMALKDFRSWVRKYNPKRTTSALRAEALNQIGYLKRLCGTLKLLAVEEWVQTFLDETDEKLILFGIHKAVLRPLQERFSSISVLVDGTVKGHHRQLAIDKFHNSKKTRLFLGNIQAAGAGWSAKCCSTVAFAEMGWTPAEHDQAESRAHGLGRGLEGIPFTAYYLIARNTYEEKLCKIIGGKQKVLNSTLDGESSKKALDVFNELMEALK